MDIKETTYYTIYQKTTDKKKIIAEVFSNNTLQTINNFKKYINDDWGYRIYLDESVNISLELINTLDFVEIFIFKLKNKNIFNNNTTNFYHFHASTDINKELIFIKNDNVELTDELLLLINKFDISDKILCGCLTPWYKPLINTLANFPFNIPSYFWGIKPKLYLEKYINYHYSFDDIVEYIIRFTNNPKILENNYRFVTNEIILTELIFSYFKVKDIYFYIQKYDLNTILLFYIIYEELKNNDSFIKILNNNFNKNNISSIDCILPYYEQIPDKNITKIFYYAYIKMLYDMVENNDTINDNINITYYELINKYMKQLLLDTDNSVIRDYIRDYTNIKDNYKFNLYYNTKIHISKLDTNKWTFISDTIFQTFKSGLLNDTILAKELYDIFFINTKKYFTSPLQDSIMYQLILHMKLRLESL